MNFSGGLTVGDSVMQRITWSLIFSSLLHSFIFIFIQRFVVVFFHKKHMLIHDLNNAYYLLKGSTGTTFTKFTVPGNMFILLLALLAYVAHTFCCISFC